MLTININLYNVKPMVKRSSNSSKRTMIEFFVAVTSLQPMDFNYNVLKTFLLFSSLTAREHDLVLREDFLYNVGRGDVNQLTELKSSFPSQKVCYTYGPFSQQKVHLSVSVSHFFSLFYTHKFLNSQKIYKLFTFITFYIQVIHNIKKPI